MPLRFTIKPISLIVGILFYINSALAMDTASFLKDFIHNYETQSFDAQVTLIKDNQPMISGAVDELIVQANQADISFEEKMWFLNIASALSYMNLHWHNDEQPLKRVEPIIKDELQKEQARLAILMKWKKEERFIGNFVMKKHRKEMENQGLPMVLYPHWLHRVMFECKVCHNDIFKMRRWENNISQQAILEGKQCGVCHNGTMAFSASDKGSCNRCHIIGLPEAEHLHNPNLVDQQKIKKAAESVGAKWRPENLTDNKLPLDRFQFIDWLELKNKDVFTPVISLDKDYKDEIRDNQIVFQSKSDFVGDVIFDHKVHSEWVKCDTCHPALFQAELGKNNIKMTDIAKGRFCGHCHGKVSFTFADCLRCHKKSIGKLSADASRKEKVLRRTPLH
ncbi:c(7)-type cytochrome triheme domain-containing protein [Pseudomonadota bacterium]